jgi:protein-S-isoprenylcysteine O-methyltransferase Ste14
MDINYLINLVLIINIVLTTSASFTSVAKGFRAGLGLSKEKPKTFLQFFPKMISTLIFISVILGIFGIGKYASIGNEYNGLRIICIIVYVISSWLQIWSFKELKELNTQDVIILKNHRVVQTGPYKFLRHPAYLFQILQDVSVGVALTSWIVLLLTIFLEIPLLIIRANYEEKLLIKHLPTEYSAYQTAVNKWIPVQKIKRVLHKGSS